MKNLQLALTGAHGLNRGTDPDFDHDGDTGGQVQYVLDTAMLNMSARRIVVGRSSSEWRSCQGREGAYLAEAPFASAVIEGLGQFNLTANRSFSSGSARIPKGAPS